MDGGAPKLLTLDELDAAFKADQIHTRTLVRRPGTLFWKTLADIAGIDDSNPTIESESLVPVASDIALPEIPKPPPLPGAAAARENAALQTALTNPELAPARSRGIRSKLAGAAVVALVGTGVFFGVSAFLSGAFTEAPSTLAATMTMQAAPEALPQVAPTEPVVAPAPTLDPPAPPAPPVEEVAAEPVKPAPARPRAVVRAPKAPAHAPAVAATAARKPADAKKSVAPTKGAPRRL
jgi:hypothetical protein